MKNKLWFQLIALILVFALTFSGVVYALQVPEVMEVMNINTVESVPAGTIDGIVIGPSTVTAAWVSAVGFENYGATTYHMGTAMKDGELVTAGGRVMFVVASAPTLREAQQKAREDIAKIECENLYHRTDIGNKAFK